MSDHVQIRRDTAANFTSVNPTPAQGEWCLETDTLRIKIGDGSTAWTSLAYFRGSASTHTINTTGGTTVLTAAEAMSSAFYTAGILVSNATIVFPDNMPIFIAENNNTGAFTTTFKTAAGSGVAVSQGVSEPLYANGTNVERPSSGGGAGSGTVTSVSVVSANGLAGTVASATTTPAITLSTTVTGVLKGDGTSISAATAGTDYFAAITVNSTTTVTTLTPSLGAGDTIERLTAQVGNLSIANPSTTPADGQMLEIDGYSVAGATITSWGAMYEANALVALPASFAAGAGKSIYFQYSASTSKLRLINVGGGR